MIKTIRTLVSDITEGRKLMQQKRKQYEYALMDRGICLIPSKESKAIEVLQKGIAMCDSFLAEFR